MEFYLAPLEGITRSTYRNAWAEAFGPADLYFAPFVTPTPDTCLGGRGGADLLPAENGGLPVVPQLLTNRADCFVRGARELAQSGYTQVNLNLGCPSGTVVSKSRGAGFLAHPDALHAFLEEIFSGSPLPISIKTRLGMERPEEFGPLLALYNEYPVAELIVHPRVRSQFYKGRADWDAFALAAAESRAPLCYNGDLFTPADLARFRARFPSVERVMLGRGVIANPALIRRLRGGAALNAEELRAFLGRVEADYAARMPGPRPTLCKLKELWCYMGCLFPTGGKLLKKLKKAQTLAEYHLAVDALLGGCPLWAEAGFCPPE